MSETKAAFPVSPATEKKPPAHEVIVRVLHRYVKDLADTEPGYGDYKAIGAVVALATVLEQMEVPEQYRAVVAAEIRAMQAGIKSVFNEREALNKAANALCPTSLPA